MFLNLIILITLAVFIILLRELYIYFENKKATPKVATKVTTAYNARSGRLSVVLTSAGKSKVAVIKVIRDVNAELGLKEAKEIVDNCGVVITGVDLQEGVKIKALLVEVGATAELK